jgi:hypothetical protein
MSQVSVLGSTIFLCLAPFPQGVWTDRQTVKSHIVSTLLRICMGDGSFQDTLWGCRAQCSLHHKNETKQRFKILLSFLHTVHHSTSLHCSPYCCTISCYHPVLLSSWGRGWGRRGDRWATFRKYKPYKYLLYCDNHFAFHHLSVQVI